LTRQQNGIRTFHVVREEDVSGVSGTGVIAEGVLWSNGHIDVRWLSIHKITEHAESLAEWQAVHGHEGKTKVIFDDEVEIEPEVKKTVLDD
jgi:hypothetical protein